MMGKEQLEVDYLIEKLRTECERITDQKKKITYSNSFRVAVNNSDGRFAGFLRHNDDVEETRQYRAWFIKFNSGDIRVKFDFRVTDRKMLSRFQALGELKKKIKAIGSQYTLGSGILKNCVTSNSAKDPFYNTNYDKLKKLERQINKKTKSI